MVARKHNETVTLVAYHFEDIIKLTPILSSHTMVVLVKGTERNFREAASATRKRAHRDEI